MKKLINSQLSSQFNIQMGWRQWSHFSYILWPKPDSQLNNQLKLNLWFRLESQLDSQLGVVLNSQLASQLRRQNEKID